MGTFVTFSPQTETIIDQFCCGRAHGVIEGDLYIGALFSIHDQVREGGNFAETLLSLLC